tara:strand:+ start:746 stop:1048 length:303 start_codon:yes stop_codon:yes gene_type:complete
MTIKIRDNLKKRDIISNIKSSIGFSHNSLQEITDSLIDTLLEIIVEEGKINIKNFGSFNIVHKKQRSGRNPLTKEEFTISSRYTIKFKPSNQLRQKIKET